MNPTKARIETALALASAMLGAITIVWRDWIEAIFHVDPDRGSGSLEWAIVVALFLAAAVLGRLALVERRKLRTA